MAGRHFVRHRAGAATQLATGGQVHASRWRYFADGRAPRTKRRRPASLCVNEEFRVIFAAPVVGRILAACAASQASASVSPTDNATTANLQIGGGETVNAAAFGQTLNNVEKAAASQPPHAVIPTI
jgi:hypothetical protein